MLDMVLHAAASDGATGHRLALGAALLVVLGAVLTAA